MGITASPDRAPGFFFGSRLVFLFVLAGAAYTAGHFARSWRESARAETGAEQPGTSATPPAKPEFVPGSGSGGTVDSGATVATTLSALLAEPAEHRRQFTLWSHLRHADAPTLRLWLAELKQLPPSSRRGGALNLLFRRWGELEPTTALAEISAFEISRRGLEEATLLGWATVDPVAALDWNRANRWKRNSNAHDFGYLEAIVEAVGVTRKHAEVAAWFTRQDPGSVASRSVASRLVETWAADDPPAVLMWITTLPPGELRLGATRSAMAALARYAPDLAIGFLDTLAEREARSDAVQAIYGNWVGQNPEAAFLSAQTHLDASERSLAAFAMAGSLAISDPDLATRCVLTLADEQSRAAVATALRGMIDVERTAPATLLQLHLASARSADDVSTLHGAAIDLLRRDPAGARDFVLNTPLLSARQRTQLLELLAQRTAKGSP